MTLLLRSPDSQTLLAQLQDGKKLGFYSVQHGMVLHIIDNDPFSISRHGGLEDVSLVPKFEMSDDVYDKREKSVRAFKRDQLAKNPLWKAPNMQNPQQDAPDASSVSHVKVGGRCQVEPGQRRGRALFAGEIPTLGGGGHWVGVALDEPVGKNDGSLGGERYFECEARYGTFVRGSRVEMGDFPERDIMDEDEI
jgi:tubulin-folding cofactor B